MRKVLATFAAVGFAVAIVAPGFAAEMTLKGQLVDVACFKSKGIEAGSGAGHAACAAVCAKKGQQVALATQALILTGDGPMYLVSGALAKDKNAQLVEHMGHTVELTGDVVDKNGVKTIMARSLRMLSK